MLHVEKKRNKKACQTVSINLQIVAMKDFTTYLSTAPVVALGWFIFTAGLLIEINRFFPDPLVFAF
jgi:photosystem I subunit IX